MDPNESFDDYLDQADQPDKKPFEINSDKLADWAVRKIVRKQALIDANKRLAKDRKQQVDDWLAVVNRESEAEISFFLELLRPYLVTRLADARSKTLKLPSGSVSMRKSSPEFSIGGEQLEADSQQLLDYVRQSCPELLTIKELVNLTAFKDTLIAMSDSGRVISSDGEIIDFMAAYQPPDKINVKGA